MRTIMVHEVNKQILKALREFALPSDILTFDDGLYSHYACRNVIKTAFPQNRKIFFISTDAVRSEEVNPNFVKCEEAMRKWVEEDSREHYMSWEEIKQMKDEGFEIGSHGHGHYYSFGETLEDQVQNFRDDTARMKEEFKKHLGELPKVHARPYNKKQPIEAPILGRQMIVFGDERVDLREIMGEPGYDARYRNFKTA